MKVIIQRVLSGSVSVEQTSVGSIGPGLVVFLGICRDDTMSEVQQLARKVLNVRLWSDDKPWNLNVKQQDMEILVISQFTLYGYLKGNRPDFHLAMEPTQAEELYNSFVEELRNNYSHDKIQTGAFGQKMNIQLEHDGPVTLDLNSK